MLRYIGTLILLCILFPLLLNAQHKFTLKADDNKEYEDQVKELEYDLISLITRKDTSAYASYLAEDYIRINRKGVESTKQDVLNEFAQKDSVIRQVSSIPSNIRVRIYGDTAVMNFDLETKVITPDKTEIHNSKLTKVLVRRKNKWFMINNQGTEIQK
ncbi:MAG: nuclear transport factor 2 family protein [Bacteroidota bacterium]|nr:nuclear transport factor 2 family protein [Bacteroidota bacterium]